MTFQHSNQILQRSLRRKGLSQQLVATTLCVEAERFAPGLFRATSLRQSEDKAVLHLKVSRQQLLDFTCQQGGLLQHLQQFAKEKGLPVISGFRLTIQEE